jgi:site-specific recombinase XerD
MNESSPTLLFTSLETVTKELTCSVFFMTIAEFLAYLNNQKQCSNTTQIAYQRDLTQFHTFWHHAEQTSTTPLSIYRAIENYLRLLVRTNVCKNSIARKTSCLNSYEKFFNHQYQITLNLRLQRPPVQLQKYTIIRPDELMTRLLPLPTTTSPYRDRLIMGLLAATGMKSTELVKIRVMDIDIPSQTVTIGAVTRVPRSLTISPLISTFIDEYLHNERPPVENIQEPLLMNYQNTMLTARSIERICLSISTYLKTTALTPMVLRHSYAFHALSQNIATSDIACQLGFTCQASIEKYSAPTSKRSYITLL